MHEQCEWVVYVVRLCTIDCSHCRVNINESMLMCVRVRVRVRVCVCVVSRVHLIMHGLMRACMCMALGASHKHLVKTIGTRKFIESYVRDEIIALRPAAHALTVLGTTMHQPTMAVNLLRHSFAHRLRHLARTTPPSIMEAALHGFDDLVAETLLGIIDEGADAVTGEHATLFPKGYADFAQSRVFRSATKGGLSIRSSSSTAAAAFTAGCLQALPVLARVAGVTRGGTDTFPALLHPEQLAVVTPTEVAELCTQVPYLAEVLSADKWASWSTMLGVVRPQEVSSELGETGTLGGAIAARPGLAESDDPTKRKTHLDFIKLSPSEVVRRAMTRKLPPRLQHILSTIIESFNDITTGAKLLHNADEEPLVTARGAWGTGQPLSRRLGVVQLHACSGSGHSWVVDTGRRFDRLGRPRRGTLHMHNDGPLEEHLFRIALRARLLLPIGCIIKSAQKHGGYDDATWPECQCHHCIKAGGPSPLDIHGLHLGAQVTHGGYTPRHHMFNEAFTSLVRSAGYSASIEKNPFKDTKDRVASMTVRGEGELDYEDDDGAGDVPVDPTGAGTSTDATAPLDGTHPRAEEESYVPKSRLDTLIYNVSMAELKTFLPHERLAHIDPHRHPYVTVLIDYTFTHPGAYLGKMRRGTGDLAPDAMGDAAVRGKDDKYLARAKQAGQVLIPFHINVYGRIHPLAYKLMNFICEKLSIKALGTPNPSAFPQADPAARVTAYKRNLMRSLSVCVQRSLALGLLQAAQRVMRPRAPTSDVSYVSHTLHNTPLINSPPV